jgi:Ni/Fe-hydrogenase subunit HybB-like protein
MTVVGIFIGAAIMAGMVYLAISKKSTSGIRIAALVSLGLMVVTVIVCLGIFIFLGKAPVDESIVLITDTKAPPPKNTGNIIILVIFMAFLIGMFITVTVISLREQKEQKKNAVKQKTAALFMDEKD